MNSPIRNSESPSGTLKVIILCGGQGTRIRDVADDIPKPMIRIGDQPILWHIMRLYAHYGIQDFVLALGYKGWLIKEYFLNLQAMLGDFSMTLGPEPQVTYHTHPVDLGWRITFAETGYANQTGSRIRQVRKYVEDADLFCVTYGDGVADINLRDLVAFHRQHGRIGTITGVRPPGRFGVLSVENQSDIPVVTEFHEKPQALEGIINGGFFVFDQRLWTYLPDRDGLIFEQEPLAQLARDGELAVFEHAGFWQPMDTFREWRILNDLWSSGAAPWAR